MSKCDFNKVITLNLLHIFRTPFPKNTSRGLLPKVSSFSNLASLTNKAVESVILHQGNSFCHYF